MSTFSQSTFDTAAYKDYRPTYDDSLFETILKKTALDVACGTGQATVSLAKWFDEVVEAIPCQNIRYKQGDSSHFNVPDQSMDLVATAQAAHWFDMPEFYSEVRRVLKPHGTLAIWGYAYCRIKGNEEMSEAIFKWGTETMKEYWDERRKILDDYYESIRPPFPEVYRLIRPTSVHASPIHKRMTVTTLQRYLKTFSCHKTYVDATKEAKKGRSAGDDDDDDPVDAIVKIFYPLKDEWDTQVVEVEWPMILILAKMQ
ncbi:S-adenosyl-L-methionine-dependent methyltransferase [Chytridium lagenaria]|nr:S-adenosyl-L-methionine-dependent methyltransferase [Chytridium lagenaria]